MAAQLIDGKALAATLYEQISQRVSALTTAGITPCLASVRIGDDEGSRLYAEAQQRAADKLGIAYRPAVLSETVTQQQLHDELAKLAADTSIHGLLLFQPLPKHLDATAAQDAIAADRDVEGVNAANLGRLFAGRDALPPCTAAAAVACTESTGVPIRGAHVVVIGRSTIVGKPVAAMMLARDATVTTCHSRTRDLATVAKTADILIVAVGKPEMIGAEHVRHGAVVIDVGTHRSKDDSGKSVVVGDVKTADVLSAASHVTPVPGGVGPLTTAMLWNNVVSAAERLVTDR